MFLYDAPFIPSSSPLARFLLCSRLLFTLWTRVSAMSLRFKATTDHHREEQRRTRVCDGILTYHALFLLLLLLFFFYFCRTQSLIFYAHVGIHRDYTSSRGELRVFTRHTLVVFVSASKCQKSLKFGRPLERNEIPSPRWRLATTAELYPRTTASRTRLARRRKRIRRGGR